MATAYAGAMVQKSRNLTKMSIKNENNIKNLWQEKPCGKNLNGSYIYTIRKIEKDFSQFIKLQNSKQESS